MMGLILWFGWLYSLYEGFTNRRFILSAIVLLTGIAVNFTPLGGILGIAAVPLWIGVTIILLLVNKFESAKRGAAWFK
jgi:hypothetical protein